MTDIAVDLILLTLGYVIVVFKSRQRNGLAFKMAIRYTAGVADHPHLVGNGIAINLVVKEAGRVAVCGEVAVVSRGIADWVLTGRTVAEVVITDILLEIVGLNQQHQHDASRFIVYFGCLGSTGALAELFDELLADCFRLELDCLVDELFFCVLDCVVDELLDDAELVEPELLQPANMMPPSRIVA